MTISRRILHNYRSKISQTIRHWWEGGSKIGIFRVATPPYMLYIKISMKYSKTMNRLIISIPLLAYLPFVTSTNDAREGTNEHRELRNRSTLKIRLTLILVGHQPNQ